MVSTKWTITKNGVLPVTTLFFWKLSFNLRTSSKELIQCTNYPNAHIRTFCKRWSFIWRCFFHVSILKMILQMLRNSRFSFLYHFSKDSLNSFGANFTKWSNTLKQFIGNLPMNCLRVFDHFEGLALKRLK